MATKETENAYRSERKERLAKNARKDKKKKLDSTGIVRIVLICVGVVVALGIVCGILWAYGVPQSVITVEKVGSRSYSIADYGYYYMQAFQKEADSAYQIQSQLGVALPGYFDYTKSPDEQTTTDSEGNTITYAEKFKADTRKLLEEHNYYLALAKEKGLVLSDEHQAAINSAIEQLTTTAQTNGYSANRYVSLLYGKGVTLKKYRAFLEEDYLVEQYQEELSEQIKDEITDEAIDAEYEKNPTDYEQVDVRLFALEIKKDDTSAAETETTAAAETETTAAEDETTAATEEETTAAAEDETTAAAAEEETTAAAADKEPSAEELLLREMLARITDEQSFIELAREYCAEEDKETYAEDTATLLRGVNKSAVSQNIDADFAEWLFSDERVPGDKDIVVTDDTVYVVYIINTAFRNEDPLVTVRHILISYDSVAAELGETKNAEGVETETYTTESGVELTNEGTGYSIEVAKQTYNKALDVFNEFNAGERTEERFADLAETYSKDTGSVGENGQTSGGLYENVQKGQMVEEFDAWIYDDARKAGDVDMVKTTYGWHIIYFVSKQEEPAYKTTIRNALATAKATELQEAAEAAVKDEAKPNTFFEDFATKEAVKLIKKLYVSTASN